MARWKNVWIDTLVHVFMEAGIERSEAQQRAEDGMLANSRFSDTSSEFR
ncbi:hypothetical protein NIES4073_04610 [Kalymmatonema gypsitolerans NIES-4073]|nr:hypothetical protein NIES4073_04610 [Scytonema sp. NIES-4073]